MVLQDEYVDEALLDWKLMGCQVVVTGMMALVSCNAASGVPSL